jgi:hypothetical protein
MMVHFSIKIKKKNDQMEHDKNLTKGEEVGAS